MLILLVFLVKVKTLIGVAPGSFDVDDVHEGNDVWVSLLRVRLLHVVDAFCHHAPFVSCFRCNFHQEPFGALEDLVLRVQQEERLHDAALRGGT